jgi:hypothetical protein
MMSNLAATAKHTCTSKLTRDSSAGLMLMNKEKNRPLDTDVNQLLSSSVEVATVVLASLGSTSYTTRKNQANFRSGILRGHDDASHRGHQWRRRPLSTGGRNRWSRHRPSKPPSPPLSRGTRHCVTDVSLPWLASPPSCPGGPADAWWMTSLLGTPRGRCDEYSSSFSLNYETEVYRSWRGETMTTEGDAC